MIQKFGTTYVLTTQKLLRIISKIEQKSNMKLSQVAMEVLSIITYNQPHTWNIEMIRGINSDGAVKTLIARGIIEAKTKIIHVANNSILQIYF